jgi:hypothetical protein
MIESPTAARHWSPFRILAAVVSVITAFGALLADLVIPDESAQHMFNDAWPPHAKFHDAQYIVLSLLLGVIGLALLGRRIGDARAQFLCACAIVATPWLGMFGALLLPGTATHDPEFEGDYMTVFGLHGQIFLAIVLLALLLLAVFGVLRSSPQAGARQ